MNIPTHRAVMTKILVDIYRDNYLLNKLGFKGGTACHFFHELPRFSVDLDFNTLGLVNEDTSESEKILVRLTELLKKYGHVEHVANKKNTLFLLLNYEKTQWNLKVEVSTRDYNDEFEVKELLGISMPVMKQEYIFAHKLTALTDRNQPVGRDVFDINYFISEGWKIKGRIIEERTGKSVEDYLKDLPKFILSNFTNKNILDGVGELLDKSSRDRNKQKLLEEVVINLKILHENYMAYIL